MANTELPPVPYKTEMLNNQGFLTNPWIAWFRQIFVRVGGNSAPTNSDLLLNPMTTVGDMIIGGTAGTPTRLTGNISTTKKFLTQTGSGSVPGSQSWGTIAAADVPTLNQNTSGSAATAASFTGNLAGDVTSTGMTTSISGLARAKIASGSAHQVVVNDSSGNLSGVSPGTSGNVLTSNGTDWVSQSQSSSPPGIMAPYAGSTAPTGWVLCDGSAISRTTFSALFGVIGSTYGAGDGSTTFNIPDTRGIFLRGSGTSGKLSNSNGTSFSATLGTYQNDQLQGHQHSRVTAQTGSATTKVQIGGAATTNDSFITDGITTDGTNGTPRIGADTHPANLGVNFIIKT